MEQTLRPYNQTWRDQLAQWVLGDQRPTAGQRSFVSGLLGSAGTGSTGASVADMTPVGGLLSAQESAQRGDMKGAALAMLPMPAAKTGAALKAALKAALPMDEASRLTRAAEQGFRVNDPLYHATTHSFDEFSPSKWRQASFFADSPEGAMRGMSSGGMEHPALSGAAGSGEKVGPNIMPVFVRGNVWGKDPLPSEWFPESLTYGEYRDMIDGKKPMSIEGLTDEQNRSANFYRNRAMSKAYTEAVPETEWHKYAGDNERAMPMVRDTIPPAEIMGYESVEGPSKEYLRDMMRRLGYPNWAVNDEAGVSIAASDPANIRSRFAAFDPSKADSKNILAGLLGLLGGGAALGASGQPQPEL
jgi:hypothetical protein